MANAQTVFGVPTLVGQTTPSAEAAATPFLKGGELKIQELEAAVWILRVGL